MGVSIQVPALSALAVPSKVLPSHNLMLALAKAPVPLKRGAPKVVMLSPTVPVSSAAKRLILVSVGA